MAVRLEHIDVLVPIELIERKYPGGLAQCLIDRRPLIGRRVWHDSQLLRDGALDPDSARALVEGWQALGFEPLVWVDGQLHWHELCVVDLSLGGPTVACDWLDWDRNTRVAWLRGLDPGPAIGRW